MKVLIKGDPAFICLSLWAEILMHSSGSAELQIHFHLMIYRRECDFAQYLLKLCSMSGCIHDVTWELLIEFLWNVILGSETKICRTVSVWIK